MNLDKIRSKSRQLPNAIYFWNKFSENDGRTLKTPFKEMIDEKIKNIFLPRNQWGQHPVNMFSGILINGWDDRNTMNTNPSFCYFLCRKVEKIDSSIVDNIYWNRWDRVIKQIGDYIDNNVDNLFPISGCTPDSLEIDFILRKSWTKGCISTVAAIYGLKLFNPEIINLEYDFKKGDKKDMTGFDVTGYHNETPITFQLKSGYRDDVFYNDFYRVNGSTNTLKYNTNYYLYTEWDENEDVMKILIFDNTKNRKLLFRDGKLLKVHKSLIKFEYKGHMGFPEKLHKLNKLLNNRRWSLNITKEGSDNFIRIDYNETKVHLNFVDPFNDNLDTQIDLVIKELENLL